MKKKLLITSTIFIILVILGSLYVLGCYTEYRDNNPASFARNGKWQEVKACLAEHPSWASRIDQEGRTVLHYLSDTELVETILNHCEPNVVDIYGFTPLHTVYAPDVVDLLLKNGADPNKKSHSQNVTPLHATVNFESLNSRRNLPIEGPSPKADRFEFTKPLESDQIAKIKLLIEYNADVNAQNIHGATPLDITWDPEIQQILIQSGGKTNTKGWEKKFGH